MKKVVLFLLCLCHLSLGAEEEIRIHLATASPLQTVYIGKARMEGAAFSESYLSSLEAIVAYDFKYNGSTKVASKGAAQEALCASKELTHPLWKQEGVAHVIRLELKGASLFPSVYQTQSGSLKSFAEIPLKGSLQEDRQQMHKLSDAIHKALFHQDGVASTHILFALQVKHPEKAVWGSEIWQCDWDGGNLRQVTHEGSECVTPVCVPQDTHQFLYVSYKSGQPKICLGSVHEEKGKRLIDLKGNQLLPTISKQRDKIAFVSNAAGRTDLFVQPLNPHTAEVGKPMQLYSYPRSTQASPTFSPDGSQIAFASDKDGGVRIYIIPTVIGKTRPNATLISKQNKENSCPCWSPDGTKLAYSAKTGNNRQIWIYDFAQREERQLTSGPGNKENPVWAPDSHHIVFNSTDGAGSELYIVNLNQPEAVKISKGPGKKHYPTWGF